MLLLLYINKYRDTSERGVPIFPSYLLIYLAASYGRHKYRASYIYEVTCTNQTLPDLRIAIHKCFELLHNREIYDGLGDVEYFTHHVIWAIHYKNFKWLFRKMQRSKF